MAIPTDNAWLHLRKSRHLGDPDDPHLLATHRGILIRLAQEDGVSIPPAHVIAELESGEFLAQRPAFLAWLEEIERLPPNSGGILYCLAFDRLSRGDPLERARVRVALRRAGILVRTPSGWLDLADPDQALLAGVKSELAEHELARYKVRIAQVRAEKLRRGEVLNGGVPFGYVWDKNAGRPVPHPARFPVLVACCREVLRESVARLAARYGVHASVLQRALHCPTICGWAARRHRGRRSRTGRAAQVILPRREWVWAEAPGDWPAACSRPEWEAIQEALEARRTRPRWTRSEDDWCRAVVRFEGAPPGAWVRLQTGGRTPAYALVDPRSRRMIAYIRRSVVHAAVTAALLPLLADPALLTAALAAQQERLTRGQPADEPDRLREQLHERRTALERLIRDSLAEPSDELRRARARVQREIEAEIRALVARLQAATAAPPASLAALPALPGLLTAVPEDWEALPAAFKSSLVGLFIAAVPVRITRQPGKNPVREVLPVVWQPGFPWH